MSHSSDEGYNSGGVPMLEHHFAGLAIASYWRCGHCLQEFSSKNARDNHEVVHLPPTVSCLACTRKFTTYPGMLIHLEAGTCDSGVELKQLNKLAARCYRWKKYLSKDFRQELMKSDASYRDSGEEPFKCPRCEDEFPLLSSLFQHVWSTACTQGRNGGAIGKLRRWLARSLFWHKRSG